MWRKKKLESELVHTDNMKITWFTQYTKSYGGQQNRPDVYARRIQLFYYTMFMSWGSRTVNWILQNSHRITTILRCSKRKTNAKNQKWEETRKKNIIFKAIHTHQFRLFLSKKNLIFTSKTFCYFTYAVCNPIENTFRKDEVEKTRSDRN